MICPSCGKDLVKHFDPSGKEYQARDGDLTVCFTCGSKNIVSEGRLVLITPKIAETLSPMERVQHQHMWEAWSQQYGMKAS